MTKDAMVKLSEYWLAKSAKKHFKEDAVLRNISKREKRYIIVRNVRKNYFAISFVKKFAGGSCHH